MISAINSGLSGMGVHLALVTAAAGNLANLNTCPGGQGALEGANVDPVREMLDLMLGQRGFEMSVKVLKTADEMLGSLLDLRA